MTDIADSRDAYASKNGRARRTVDLSGLSKAGRHESHHTRSAAEIVKTVPAGKLKSTLDCVDGYHGVELAEKDCHKTTFATESGLYATSVYPKVICLRGTVTPNTPMQSCQEEDCQKTRTANEESTRQITSPSGTR